MAQPLMAALGSALSDFSRLILHETVHILLIPFFPTFHNYINPPPLNFHLHFEWDPAASDQPLARQFKLDFARETTQEEITVFLKGNLGAASAVGSHWDTHATKNSSSACTLRGTFGRRNAIVTVIFSAAQTRIKISDTKPGKRIVSLSHVTFVPAGTRSGADPRNLGLDWTAPLRRFLEGLPELDTPYKNIAEYSRDQIWREYALEGWASVPTAGRARFVQLSQRLQAMGTQLHPAYVWYSDPSAD